MRLNVANGKKLLLTARNCRPGYGAEQKAGVFCPRPPSTSRSETCVHAVAGYWRQEIVADGKKLSPGLWSGTKSRCFLSAASFSFAVLFSIFDSNATLQEERATEKGDDVYWVLKIFLQSSEKRRRGNPRGDSCPRSRQ